MPKPDDEEKSASEEVRSVRVDLADLPDFAEEELPDFSASSSSKTNDLPALDPEHELHVEVSVPESEPREVPAAELPVLGAEHEIHEEELPVLGPEHELQEEELPVLGPEHELHEEELPVLGPEHELHEEELLSASEPEPRDKPPSEPPPEPDPEEELAAVEADDPELSRNYRKIYESELRPLERDARIGVARTAEGPLLSALCLDAEPQVIRAVLENPLAGLDHARLIARHHKNPVGLEAVVQRAEFARDTQVQRLLVRNNQMTESLLRRLIGGKPLRELYKSCIDRDVPDRNRVASRGLLRARWGSSSSEDRADFVMATEARCLSLLVGQTFDSRMTSILCGRQFNSVVFIQNLARFPACPPALLVHLLRQPFVRKHAALKKMLFQHPNVPSQAKRTL